MLELWLQLSDFHIILHKSLDINYYSKGECSVINFSKLNGYRLKEMAR